MVMREISLYILLGHFFIAPVGSQCLPVECLKCNTTGNFSGDSCQPCPNDAAHCVSDYHSNCKRKDFQVSINSTRSSVDEGESFTLPCVHNLPNMSLTFEWTKDNKVEKGQTESKLAIKKMFKINEGEYRCSVNSSCGSFSSSPHSVTVNTGSLVILVICGVSALVLVLIMGLVMKFKLKRDTIKHRERMNRRVQVGQSGGPSTITPRES